MVSEPLANIARDAGARRRRLLQYLSKLLHYASKERRLDANQLALIASSDYFDPSYYRSRYEDVAESGMDPVIHYLDYGAYERRNPSAWFNTAEYLTLHPGLFDENINPLVHFLRNRKADSSTIGPTPLPLQQASQVSPGARKPTGTAGDEKPGSSTNPAASSTRAVTTKAEMPVAKAVAAKRTTEKAATPARTMPKPPLPVKPASPIKTPAPETAAASAKPAPPSKPAAPPKLSTFVSYLNSLDDDNLIATLQRIESSVLLPRARDHFKKKAWQKLTKLSRSWLDKRPDQQRLLLIYGRANIYAGNEEGASQLLSIATLLFPDNAEAQHYYGVVHLRVKAFEPAIARFRLALKLAPDNLNIKRDLGRALRQASRIARMSSQSQAMATEAATLLTELYRAQPSSAAALIAAQSYYELRKYEECNALLDEVVREEAGFVEHLVLKSKALLGLNRIQEALTVVEQALRLEPENQAAGLLLRTCKFLTGDEKAGPPTFGQLILKPNGTMKFRGLYPTVTEPETAGNDLNEIVAQLPYDWVLITPDPADLTVDSSQRIASRLASQIDPVAGFHAEGEFKFWKRKALVELTRAGLLEAGPTDLVKYEPIYGSSPPAPYQGATAVVMSRNGSFKFGGGEHLLESMAEHYRSLGYSPVIVGTRPEFRGKFGEVNGFRFAFLDDNDAALRRFFVENDVRLVHAISGLGYRVANALAHTNIPFIYGVHYWREVLGQEDEGFFDASGEPIPRPEFHYILSRAATVYANSVYTRDIIEKAFGVRCPVVYSLPKDAEDAA